jgi:DNA-binding HxlR family transcriptional regulator
MNGARCISLQIASEGKTFTCFSQATWTMACTPKSSSRRSGCPISISLEIFGDRWSLLIIRDLLFTGRRTFNEFSAAGEGIASNVLADRLQRLEGARLIDRNPHPGDGRRAVYRLTRKGLALASVLVEMIVWAARYEDTDAPPAVVKAMETDRHQFVADLRARWVAEGRGRSGEEG